MSTQSNNSAPGRLLDVVQSPSVRASMDRNVQAPGARTAGATLQTQEIAEWLGDDFARQRLLAATPDLLGRGKDSVVFAGGACAVDPLRSAALARGLVFDPETGQASRAADLEAICANLLGPVTLAQALDVIGPTDGRSLAIAETDMWAAKVCADLEKEASEGRYVLKPAWTLNDADRELVRGVVANLNQRILGAAQGIRQLLFPGSTPLTIVQDGQVLPELTKRTYDFYRELGLPIDKTDSVIPVLGMYTGAWRETLVGQGLMAPDDVLAVYEPMSHMGLAKGNTKKTTMVQTMLAATPYLGPGRNRQVAALTYAEALLPNGLSFSANVPPALQPNSGNVGRFDFSRYPILELQKGRGATGGQEFRFLEKIGNLDLPKNPAFLWAVTVFPPTAELVQAVGAMQIISQASKDYVNTARKEGGVWQALPTAEQNALSAFAREQASKEMQAAAEQVISILEAMCRAIFSLARTPQETKS